QSCDEWCPPYWGHFETVGSSAVFLSSLEIRTSPGSFLVAQVYGRATCAWHKANTIWVSIPAVPVAQSLCNRSHWFQYTHKPALPFLVCKDVFDSSGVDKASLAVVFEVVESHGDAAQGLEAAVDGFGGPVGRVLVGEIGQDVGAASFQGASQRPQFGAAACGCWFGQRVDSAPIMRRPKRGSLCR
ncbi:hypothetical protein CQR56_1804, partial [Bifidobacterium pseudolongum subsp. globosum]